MMKRTMMMEGERFIGVGKEEEREEERKTKFMCHFDIYYIIVGNPPPLPEHLMQIQILHQ